MAGFANFPLSLELTNLIPTREIALNGFSKALNYARQLRRSGSDIVVEADLGTVFGQLKVTHELKQAFEVVVRGNSIVPIHQGSGVVLASGAGPTVTNALENQELLATVIQLSMLAFFSNRETLATMISEAMNTRFKAGIKDAFADPGVDGIARTLHTCSSQTLAFEWNVYKDKMLHHLQASISDYEFSMSHLVRISTSMILAFMDMLSIVQRFPEERRITASNDTGCLIIILWAHCIGGLTVSVVTEAGEEAKFGSATTPNVVILSQRKSRGRDYGMQLMIESRLGDPIIRLHKIDMSIIFECQPTPDSRIPMRIEERHPLAGYGTESLIRLFNSWCITPRDDPIYKEASLFVAAQTIHLSTKLYRSHWWEEREPAVHDSRKFSIEIWRILDAAKLFFKDLGPHPMDLRSLETYVKYLDATFGDANSLPSSFDNFVQRHGLKEELGLVDRNLVEPMQKLSASLLSLSCVDDIKNCAGIPLLLNPRQSYWSLPWEVYLRVGDKEKRINLKPSDMFYSLACMFSSSADFLTEDARKFTESTRNHRQSSSICLYSDFGWSIFLDTMADKTPSETRPEVIHLREGTPKKESTGERRLFVTDGILFTSQGYPNSYPVHRGAAYTPRCSAGVGKATRDWVTTATEFECTSLLTLKPSAEWLEHCKVPSFEECHGYRQFHEWLWEVDHTPACKHSKSSRRNLQGRSTKLGPSAATILG